MKESEEGQEDVDLPHPQCSNGKGGVDILPNRALKIGTGVIYSSGILG